MTEIIGYSQCGKVDKCQNNQCFFRRRDVFCVNPWHIPDEKLQKENMDKHHELDAKYGEQIFPRVSASIGTNVIYVNCEDYKSA